MRSKSAVPYLSLLLLLSLCLAGCGERATAPDGGLGGTALEDGPYDSACEKHRHGERDTDEPSIGGTRFWETPKLSDIVASDNEFGFHLFRQLVSENPESNVVISPLSVSIALGMTLNGADGQTFEDMRSTLGFAGYPAPAINQCFESLIRILTSLDPAVTFEVANSIWCREGIPFKEAFLRAGEAYYGAQISNLDFGASDAAGTINGWVAEKTHDKIRTIVKDPIDPLTMIVLINAIYFNGAWKNEFSPDATCDAQFRLPDGTWRPCRLMVQADTCGIHSYLTTRRFRALDMPYGDGVFSMTVFLPNTGHTLGSVIEGFNQRDWEGWMQSFRPYCGRMGLPRFEVEYGLLMNDVLSALGMGIIFDSLRADFTRMCTAFHDFYIQAVRHKTYVRVDERGTEAAAVTSVEGGPTSVPPSFVVRQPFVFVIRDNRTNTILFIGQITDPGYFTE